VTRYPKAPRRGAALIGVTIALSAILAASGTSFLCAVVMRGKQSAYERDAIQALYAAEAGVATAVAILNSGGEVKRGLRGECGDATWEYTGGTPGSYEGMQFCGTAAPRIGEPVARTLRVTLQRRGGQFGVARWERVPVDAPPKAPPVAAPANGGESE